MAALDWSLFHALNGFLRGDDAAQDAVEIVNAWAIVALAAAVGLAWLWTTPGRLSSARLAVASAALSAPLGLLVNAILGRVWYHPRPFVDHPRETVLLVRHAADNSFPSDHATVAFAIAFSVLAFHRRLGLAFLAAAIAVAVVRVLVGVHYPVDVGASALVAAGSTAVVVTVGRPWVVRLASLGSRISDPLLSAATRRIVRARRSARR